MQKIYISRYYEIIMHVLNARQCVCSLFGYILNWVIFSILISIVLGVQIYVVQYIHTRDFFFRIAVHFSKICFASLISIGSHCAMFVLTTSGIIYISGVRALRHILRID